MLVIKNRWQDNTSKHSQSKLIREAFSYLQKGNLKPSVPEYVCIYTFHWQVIF